MRLINFAEDGDLGSLNLEKYDQLAEIDKIRSIRSIGSISRDVIKVIVTETHTNFVSLVEVLLCKKHLFCLKVSGTCGNVNIYYYKIPDKQPIELVLLCSLALNQKSQVQSLHFQVCLLVNY